MKGEQNLGVQHFDAAYARHARLTTDVLLQGKWRIEILCAMRRGPVRLGQLARLIPDASKKMLTQNLRKLEADGIVIRSDLSDTTLGNLRDGRGICGTGICGTDGTAPIMKALPARALTAKFAGRPHPSPEFHHRFSTSFLF